MNSGIYLIQDNGQLVEMASQPYDSEALLQGLLANYPSLLAGDQIDTAAPRRWLLISRETPIPAEEGGAGRWAVDHLFLDQDGIPTLVEVKRSTDTRIRREVVGQMLDYAANAVVYWPVETIRAQFVATCTVAGRDPDQVLAEFLGADADTDALWHQVKTNLQAGKVRMIFVADEIPTELQRIVEFLNQQMDPAQVLAVEIKQFVGQQFRTLVPRLIGQTAAAQQAKASSGLPARQWDEISFFQELESRQGAHDAKAVRAILEWVRPRVTRVWWGEGKRHGSCVPVLNYKGRDHQLFALWTYGTVEIYFYWYQYRPPFDSAAKRLEMLQRLNVIEGMAIPDDGINRRPGFPLSLLHSEAALQQFLATFDWFIREVKTL
jgi:hypothetical protein